jgi:hypothetical protein
VSEDLGDLQDMSFARASSVTVAAYPPDRRLAAGPLADYLDRRAFAVVGSGRPTGRPHAAVTSYVRRGATFWLPTVAGAARERNVRTQPWMTLTVTEGERTGHVVVLIEGPADIPDYVPADVRAAVTGDWVGTWIRLRAARVFSYAADTAVI